MPASSAHETERAARSAFEAAERALGAVRAAEQAVRAVAERREEAPLRRTVALVWVVCLLCVALAALGIMHAVQAFVDPRLLSDSYGFLTVAVESGVKDAFPNQGPTIVETSYDLEKAEVHYRFLFPQEDARRRFVLALSGASIVNDPSGVGIDIDEQRGGCAQFNEVVPPIPGQACQFLYGQLPAADDLSLTDGSDSPPCTTSGDKGFGTTPGGRKWLQVNLVGGVSELVTPVDWAHDVVTLPQLTRATWRGLAAGPRGSGTDWFRPLEVAGCRTLKPPVDSVVVDQDPSSQSTSRVPTWTTTAGQIDDIVRVSLRHRDAEAQGNIYLATGGAVAALAVGLVPVGFDLTRRRTSAWWRRRKAPGPGPHDRPTGAGAGASGEPNLSSS